MSASHHRRPIVPTTRVQARRRILTTAAALAAATALPARAQPAEWKPSRPIRIIVPFPPGGSTDVLARAFGLRLTARLGPDVIVENRSGGATVPGSLAAAKATPDGHTLLLASDSSFAINPHTIKNMPYDALKDLVPVMILGVVPNWIVVNAGRPEKTFGELVEFIRRNPGKATFSVNAPGGQTHLVLESWKKASGLDFTVVPYQGLPPALIDLLGGRITATADLIAGTFEQVREGKLRALAVLSEKRAGAAPEVPAYAESGGQKGLGALSTFAFFAPGGTPPDRVARLHRELAAIAEEPEMIARMRPMGIDVLRLSPKESAEFVRRQYDRFGAIVRDTGFQPN
jgi:tripartite-type tricarboxylate transporter receptor subunit TctC